MAWPPPRTPPDVSDDLSQRRSCGVPVRFGGRRAEYGHAVPKTPPPRFDSVPTRVLVVLVTVALILFVALIMQGLTARG